jgi:hypothetical protein
MTETHPQKRPIGYACGASAIHSGTTSTEAQVGAVIALLYSESKHDSLNQTCDKAQFQRLSPRKIPAAIRFASNVVEAHRAADDQFGKPFILNP